MTAVNLHISNDPNGFFTNKTVDFIHGIQPGKNIFVNTARHCINKREEIEYCDVSTFLQKHPNLNIRSVIFHSYNYFNKGDLLKLKSAGANRDIKFIWIFWSHEYYQLPELIPGLYQGLSRRFYFRKIISFHVEQLLRFVKGESRSPFYSGIRSFRKTFKHFDLFCAFLEGDFRFVMGEQSAAGFSFVAYLTLNDFPDISNDLSRVKSDIMIGHSGSPILNHYEIVKQLSDMNVSNKLFIPLSYGKKSYLDLLTREIGKFRNLSISLQTDFLSKDAYYRKIDNVGYFILNSFCQQALGNIVFFLWTGTKIFLRKETSTFKTLSEKSFYVYSIEEDLNEAGLVPLSLEQKQHNHKLISQMLDEDNVKSSWLRILNFAG